MSVETNTFKFTNIPVSAGCTIEHVKFNHSTGLREVEELTFGVPDETGDMIVAVLIDTENGEPHVVEYFFANTGWETVENFATGGLYMAYLESTDNIEAQNTVHRAIMERKLHADCYGYRTDDYAVMPESWVKSEFASQRLPI